MNKILIKKYIINAKNHYINFGNFEGRNLYDRNVIFFMGGDIFYKSYINNLVSENYKLFNIIMYKYINNSDIFIYDTCNNILYRINSINTERELIEYNVVNINSFLIYNKYIDHAYFGTDIMNNLPDRFLKNVKKIYFQIPAIHWLESTILFPNTRIEFMIQIIKQYKIKHINTSNQRMKSYLTTFFNDYNIYNLNINVIRIGFNNPITYNHKCLNCIKKSLFNDNDIIMCNTGGAWCWSDFNLFLKCFIKFIKQSNRTDVKFIQFGLKQPNNNNIEQSKYYDETNNILKENSYLINKCLFIKKWSKMKCINAVLPQMSIGINVNKNTLENKYSERVRISDYMKYNLFILTTDGSQISDEMKENKIGHVIKAEKEEDYNKFFNNIDKIYNYDLEYRNIYYEKYLYKNILDKYNP
jgi:hypothetical protein